MKDLVDRVFWTFLQASTAVLVGGGVDLFDAGLWESAASGGLAAVVAAVSIYARRRLDIIPEQ